MTKHKPKCTNTRHKWQRIQCGCKENPGVIGLSGAAIAIFDQCKHCGVERRTIVGDVNEYGNRNGVTYSE